MEYLRAKLQAPMLKTCLMIPSNINISVMIKGVVGWCDGAG